VPTLSFFRVDQFENKIKDLLVEMEKAAVRVEINRSFPYNHFCRQGISFSQRISENSR